MKKRSVSSVHKPVLAAKPPPRLREGEQKAAPKPEAGLDEAFRLPNHPLSKRRISIVIATIRRLENLLSATPQESSDRPELLRRLAEEYVELRKMTTTQAHVELEEARRAKGQEHEIAYRKARARATKNKKLAEMARRGAIRHYALLARDYPTHPKVDEVLYYLAYEYERGEQFDKARKVYFKLIQQAPTSRFIPNAYLAFGELFFNEAQADPAKWELARQAYEKVVQYPQTDKAHGYARYKLAYVHWNRGDHAQALGEFARVVRWARQHSKLSGASQLAEAARRDLIPVYAAVGKPIGAHAFLRPLSNSDEQALELLNELGLAYLDTGRYAEGIALFHDLKKRDFGERWCSYQTRITEATAAVASGDKPAIAEALDAQLAAEERFAASDQPEEQKRQCSSETAALVAETAMSWHLEAVGTGDTRGTLDQRTMTLAARLYDKLIGHFDADQFERFRYPYIVKEDWPTLYKLKYARADLYYFQKDWDNAASAFGEVVEQDPNHPDSADAAFAMALAYQKIYLREHQGASDREGLGDTSSTKASDFEAKKLSPSEAGMLDAFNRYMCIVDPNESATIREQFIDISFARARIYFEAQRWREAATAFLDIAVGYPKHEAAIHAANLYLESLNVLRTHHKLEACVEDMARDVKRFSESFCRERASTADHDQCAIFDRVACDTTRLKAEALVERADLGKTEQPREAYEQAAELYLGLWQRYGEPAIHSGEEPRCDNLAEVLYSGAKAFQAAHLLAKSIHARKILLNEKWGFADTKLAEKAAHELGLNYQALAAYEQAAEWYETYAKKTSYQGEHVATALNDAVVLRLGLGQPQAALRIAKKFQSALGARAPAQAAQIAYAVAAHYANHKDWHAAGKHLKHAMRHIDNHGDIDVRAQAHALMGRVHAKQGRDRQAAREYEKVLALWRDSASAVKELEQAERDPGAQARRLGRALTAVGEAQYFAAEQKRKRAERLSFPEYSGPTTKQAVSRHIKTKVKRWVKRKRPLIEEATQAYRSVLDLEPVPPPKWVIAAGERVGQMWSEFVNDFRRAPVPASFRRDPELLSAYTAAIAAQSEKFKAVARNAYETCLDYAVKYQYFDTHSRGCEEWLAENYSSEFHLLDEFRGAPRHLNNASFGDAPVLELGGTPLRASASETEQKHAER